MKKNGIAGVGDIPVTILSGSADVVTSLETKGSDQACQVILHRFNTDDTDDGFIRSK